MSFIDALKRLFAGAETRRTNLYVVDASRLTGSSARLSPRDQIDIMKRIGRFAEREGLEVHTLFEGKPLRVADHGESFNGVTVYYTGDNGSRENLALKHVRRGLRGGGCVFISGDPALSARAEAAGAQLLSSSTFRKVVDAGGAGAGPETRPASGNSRRRRGRRPNRKPKDDREGGSNEDKPQDVVSELLDIVE
jgi:hypothetical protein